MAIGISPSLPLVIDSKDGAYGLNKTLRESIRQNLKNLILTAKGERVMLPDFGVGLRNFLFEQFNPIVLTNISDEIKSQVSNYMPFVNVRRINFADSESNPGLIGEKELRIEIVYDILPLDDTDTLTITEVTS